MILNRIIISLFSLFLLGNSNAYADPWVDPYIAPHLRGNQAWQKGTVTAQIIIDTLNALGTFLAIHPGNPQGIPCDQGVPRTQHIVNRHQLTGGTVLNGAIAATGALARNPANGYYGTQAANILNELGLAAAALLINNIWQNDVAKEATGELIQINIALPQNLVVNVYSPANDHIRAGAVHPGHWKALSANSLCLQYRKNGNNIFFTSAFFVVWGEEAKECICNVCTAGEGAHNRLGH